MSVRGQCDTAARAPHRPHARTPLCSAKRAYARARATHREGRRL